MIGLISAGAIWMFVSMGIVKREDSLEERLASAGKVAVDLYYNKDKRDDLAERARQKMIRSGVQGRAAGKRGPWEIRDYKGNVDVDLDTGFHAEIYDVECTVANEVTYERWLKERGIDSWEKLLEEKKKMPEHIRRGNTKLDASYRLPIAQTPAGELFFEDAINFGWFVGVGVEKGQYATQAKFDLKLPNAVYLKDILPQIIKFAGEMDGVKVKPLYFTEDGQPVIKKGSHVYVYVRRGEEAKIPKILHQANYVGTRIWGDKFKPNYNDFSSGEEFSKAGIKEM